MCKSFAEGGQRCAGHTRPRVRAAETALAEAQANGTQARIRRAESRHFDALAAYATTTEGESHVRDLMAADLERGDRLAHNVHEAALFIGLSKRDQAEFHAQAYRRARKAEQVTAHLKNPEAVQNIISRVRDGGGLTLDPRTGTEPTSGYCINTVGSCPKIPESEFLDPATGGTAIRAFLTDYADWFTQGDGTHIGFWHDKANHVVVLDRVDVVQDLAAATRLGKERHQRAMWDVTNQCEIDLR